MGDTILLMRIERLKDDLYKCAMRFGITDSVTLAKSQELDDLIFKYTVRGRN